MWDLFPVHGRRCESRMPKHSYETSYHRHHGNKPKIARSQEACQDYSGSEVQQELSRRRRERNRPARNCAPLEVRQKMVGLDVFEVALLFLTLSRTDR